MIFDTQTSYKAALIKTRDTHIVQMHWAGIRQWNKSGGSKKTHCFYGQLVFDKGVCFECFSPNFQTKVLEPKSQFNCIKMGIRRRLDGTGFSDGNALYSCH